MEKDNHVNVQVNAGSAKKTLIHNWRYIGYDECNYTHTPQGKELLDSFGKLEDAPYFVRAHHLLCTGNCHGTYKWGSTNAYTEDKDGNPIYRWDVIDSILEAILHSHNKPFVELGFMPLDLLDPAVFQNVDNWSRYSFYVNKGHTYPPKDYGKWHDLVCALAEHAVGKYGKQEVLTWYWELWNEPDISYYWNGTIDDYCKLYDYTSAALHSVLPEAKLGGPATTGPEPGTYALRFLEEFLEHCQEGKNYVTGQKGSRLDFVTFHVKGGGYYFQIDAEKKTPSVKLLTKRLKVGLEAIKNHGYQGLEIVLSEADPDGWAAGGSYDNSNHNFRNTEYYASYIAAAYHQINKIAQSMRMDVRPLAWAFLFIGERCFEGTRAFSTQGIKKASFNMFRVFSKLGKQELALQSSQEQDSLAEGYPAEGPEVSGTAAYGENSVQVMLYSHHDDWDIAQKLNIALNVSGLPFSGMMRIKHYRIDAEHSNAYAEWKRQNKPDYPDEKQFAAIKARDGLELFEPEQTKEVRKGSLALEFLMPAHAVSLIEISPLE